ncbi:MAG: apolipoprotein N-acyltransferase [Treponema sp.]|uniref:apolipoprotein N-acyltransferase n=1 Tax=Treponema sp. TaxID=166 RepID=UPI00298E3A66|nr:apolipoprotein N-acyltransferase [Treponema sp.]MBR5932948.1 apolipoprotein N-acyltransferase [Treponema sp.]
MKLKKITVERLIMTGLEVLSAALLSLSVPNEFFKFGLPFAGFICLVPHYIALQKASSTRFSCFLCFVQCLLTHVFSSFWLANFKNFAIFTLGASALATGVIHCVFGFLFYLPKKVKGTSWISHKCFRILWFSAVYTVFEFIKCSGFLAYPWGTLPMSCYHFKYLSQIVDITGVRGLTLILSLSSAVCAEFILDIIENKSLKTSFSVNKIPVFSILLLVLTADLYGIFQYNRKRIPEKALNTILIQQNADPWIADEDATSIKISQKLTDRAISEFTDKIKLNPDLIVWSEGILRFPLPEGIYYYSQVPSGNPLIRSINRNNCPIIIGAPYTIDYEELKFSNSAILFGQNGEIRDHYEKIKLVPCAEYIPFTQFEPVRKILKKLVGFANGWIPGTEFKCFDIPLRNEEGQSVKVSVPICFEDAFGYINAGFKKQRAEVLINITDDSWSLTKSAEYQHYVVSWFRAIEFRTTLVRSTNSGFTCVVDPAGRLRENLPLFEENYLCARVPVYKSCMTFYLIMGEWLSYILCAFIVIFIIYSLILKKH